MRNLQQHMLNGAAALAISVGLASGVANAQQVDADEGAKVYDTIVVTTRFREETVQDIGASMTALGGDDLSRGGIQSFDDIAKSVAGVQNIRGAANNNDISIRGISNARGPGIGNNTTSTLYSLFYDDVSVSSPTASQRDLNLFDLNRVEIVRGPQPTLFGEGSVGGTIRYFSSVPDLDGETVTGVAHARLGSIEDGGLTYTLENATSLVLVPGKLGVRVTGFFTEDEGFIDNPVAGIEDANSYETAGGKAVLLARPTEDLEVRVSAYIANDDINESNAVDPNSDPEALTFSVPVIGETTDNFELYSARVSYDFGAIQATSITGYYEREREVSIFDVANSGFFGFVFPTISADIFNTSITSDESFSQEFRFVSNFDGPLNFTAGLMYQDRDFPFLGAVGGDSFVNVLTPSTPNISELVFDSSSKEYSGFAEFTYEVSDSLRVIGGTRYISEEVDSELVVDNTIAIAQIFNPDGSFNTFDASNPLPVTSAIDTLNGAGVGTEFSFELERFLPRIAVELDLSEDVLVYANYAIGARNGGLNQPVAAFTQAGVQAAAAGLDPVSDAQAFDAFVTSAFLENITYDEDTVKGLDVGVKAVWLDGALTTNLGLFYNQYEDTQLFAVIGGSSSLVNGPDQDIFGLEFEGAYEFTEEVSGFLNFTLLDTEFKDTLAIAPNVMAGNEAINAPSLSLSAGLDASFPLPVDGWDLVVNGSYQYVGKRYSSNENFAITRLDEISTINLNAGMQSDQVSLKLFASNLFNEIENTGVFAANTASGPLNFGQTVSRPRTIGVDLTVRY